MIDRVSGEVSATLPRWHESSGRAAGFRLALHDADAVRSTASLTVISDDSWRTLPLRVVVTEGGFPLVGARIVFDTPTPDGMAFAAADLLGEIKSILHPDFGRHAIGSMYDGSLLFVADGWTWQEAPGESLAMLAGEATTIEAKAADAIVFHARWPFVTYWLESD